MFQIWLLLVWEGQIKLPPSVDCTGESDWLLPSPEHEKVQNQQGKRTSPELEKISKDVAARIQHAERNKQKITEAAEKALAKIFLELSA